MKRLFRIALMMVLAVGASVPTFYVAADDRIESVAQESQAQSVDGGIKLTANGRVGFEIYSITGQRVKSTVVENSSVKVELPKGCYIVRCSEWSKKVVVK